MQEAISNRHEDVKEKVMFPEIVVRGTKDKPYYEIKYYDVTDKQWHLGYGSYNLEYVMQWKEECLDVVEGSISNGLCEKIKERLEEEVAYQNSKADAAGKTCAFEEIPVVKAREKMAECYEHAIEIVNQVAEEYIHHNDCENCLSTEYIQDKLREMYEDGYTKALDDAIEKFLEYGCFMIQWSPRLSKEKLVTDVLHQAKGQVVYTLEKMKEKYGTDINVGSKDDCCEWVMCDEDENVYNTACGNSEMLFDGSPIDNNYSFCPYCGKKIKVVK